MNFNDYCTTKGYSANSIRTQNSYLRSFKRWCKATNKSAEDISYEEVLQFIDHERERGLANISIIRSINSIRIYHDYLVAQEMVSYNVVSRIKLRHTTKKVLVDRLDQQQLATIYQNYLNYPSWKHKTKVTASLHTRNVVILGLLVYQGITIGEIAKLEASHIQLSEGKIYIPATRKSNARVLQLAASQILPLQTYLSKNTSKTYLFTTKKTRDMVGKVLFKVKEQHSELIDSRQIRASVIMNWLEQYTIREVQYKAGHKTIKSTERYRREDLRDLTRQLEEYHPLE